ncbi:hypothetical protein V8E55_007059 [Tylopilus felleus]
MESSTSIKSHKRIFRDAGMQDDFPSPCHAALRLSRTQRYPRTRSTWGSICKTSCMVSRALTQSVARSHRSVTGIELGLYFKTVHVFLTRRRERWKCDIFYAVVSTMMLILITMRVASEGVYGQKMWLVDRDYPGGPLAYGVAHASDAYMDLGAAAVVVLQQMAGALMIYRCQVVWGNVRAIVVPSILWLANLALGILVSWGAATLWTSILVSGFSGRIGLAYTIISVTLNATLTCMIWYRLTSHARTAKKCHGDDDGIAIDGLVVESALPYTLSGVVFLISYAVGSQIGIALLSVYTLMMCVSPQMLILRIAEGKAWQKDRKREEGDLSGGDRSSVVSGAVALDQLDTV